MAINIEIREGLSADLTGIEQLYPDAFPDEDLLPLVRELLGLGQEVISLVAIHEDEIVGHISFTICHVEGANERVALLAPLAVKTIVHKQGIGGRLIQAGFEQLEGLNMACVFVLGDPAYYSRFGFRHEDRVHPPYPMPEEWRGAWQSYELHGAKRPIEGSLVVPEPWRKSALWSS